MATSSLAPQTGSGASDQRLWTKDFILIALVNLFLALNFYFPMIVISEFAISRFQATPGEAGLAVGIFIIGTLVARFFSGNVMSRVGPAAVLYAGVALSLVASALYFLAGSLMLLLLIRFLHGATFGIATTATATIVANIIPRSRVGEGIGYFGLSMTVASAIGPFLGMMLSQKGDYDVIFGTCVVMSAVAIFLSLGLNRQKLRPAEEPTEKAPAFALSSFLELKVLPIALTCMVLAFCQSSVIAFLAVYAKEIQLVTAANVFFIVFSAVLFFTRPPVGRLFDRRGENLIMYPAIGIHAVGLVAMSQAHHGAGLLLAAALIALGFGSVLATGQSVAVKAVAPHRMGLATSTFFMLTDLGFGVGPFVFGLLIPLTGFRGMYLAAAGVVAAAMALYYLMHGRQAAQRLALAGR